MRMMEKRKTFKAEAGIFNSKVEKLDPQLKEGQLIQQNRERLEYLSFKNAYIFFYKQKELCLFFLFC